jgi:membrane-associated protease RseP (regulator of RpoE activity)
MKSVGTAFTFGGSLLFEGLKSLFQDDPNFPPSFEIMHYPFILAGFLGLFFTALNLLPIGQLDGGHVTYGLFGAKRAGIIARVTVLLLLFLGGLGTFSESAFVMPPGETFVEFLSWVIPTRLLYLGFLFFILQRIFKDESTAFQGGAVVVIAGLQFVLGFLFAGLETNLMWLFYALMTVRFIGVDHPIALDDRPLTLVQKVMGVLAILIFVICFSPNPLSTL